MGNTCAGFAEEPTSSLGTSAALREEEHIDTFTSTLSLLDRCYYNRTVELGFTAGHKALTSDDQLAAERSGSSLLYGEILPSSFERLLDEAHLDASNAKKLVDLGMGTGKAALQAFLHPHGTLHHVVGIELSRARYEIAEQAALRLVRLLDGLEIASEGLAGEKVLHLCSVKVQHHDAGERLVVFQSFSPLPAASVGGADGVADGARAGPSRVLELFCGDMFDSRFHGIVREADVALLHVDLPLPLKLGRQGAQPKSDLDDKAVCQACSNSPLFSLIGHGGLLKAGCRVASYEDVTPYWDQLHSTKDKLPEPELSTASAAYASPAAPSDVTVASAGTGAACSLTSVDTEGRSQAPRLPTLPCDPKPFAQLEVNKSPDDVTYTSWAPKGGHKLFLFEMV